MRGGTLLLLSAMKFQKTAAIMSVGDELTLGQTLDTNSKWLAQRLLEVGITARIHLTVADELDAQRAAFKQLSATCDVIVCTGGLGPTADDLTREALALATDDQLVIDEVSQSQVQAWFTSRGRVMADINNAQALRPSRGMSLPNLQGTAPGLYASITRGEEQVGVFCLPGPPREMIPMFEAQVLPRLRPDPDHQVQTRTLHCFGIGESDLAMRLGLLMERNHRPLVGTTASGGVVSIRIRHEGPMDDDAVRALSGVERACQKAAGEYYFGTDDSSFAMTIVRLLQERAQTLATVESCTGGLLAAMLTDVPGASTVYAGGLVVYSNEQKHAMLNISLERFAPGGPGAVSAETAGDMALCGREKLGATHALSITGVAGPGGGSKAKPVGTVWISRASSDRTADTRCFEFSGDRYNIRLWAAMCAMAMLRYKLLEIDGPLLRQSVRV